MSRYICLFPNQERFRKPIALIIGVGVIYLDKYIKSIFSFRFWRISRWWSLETLESLHTSLFEFHCYSECFLFKIKVIADISFTPFISQNYYALYASSGTWHQEESLQNKYKHWSKNRKLQASNSNLNHTNCMMRATSMSTQHTMTIAKTQKLTNNMLSDKTISQNTYKVRKKNHKHANKIFWV